MVLPIVKYGHAILRKKGASIGKIDGEIIRLIRNMLDTMKANQGVGLAAQQVGHALQLAVVDVRGVSDRPSRLHWEGEDVDPGSHMPLVLINPVIRPLGEPASGPEGCLSFPEIYADIPRAPSVEVHALDENGKAFEFGCGGLLARAVQHEYDHLQGILFIDRMTRSTKQGLKEELEELQAAARAGID
jgi:peptide deformylase